MSHGLSCEALPPIHPKAVESGDDYLVVTEYEAGKFRIVESHCTFKKAIKAANILNDHDLANGRMKSCDVYHIDDVTILKG